VTPNPHRGGQKPDPEQLVKGAAAVRSLPLRLDAGDRQLPPNAVLRSGWFSGPTECARVLESLCRTAASEATAFGGSWPVVKTPLAVVAPAIPLLVGPDEREGPDGVYRRRATSIYRESGGCDREVVTWGERPPSGREMNDRPQLLWFDDTARFLVHGGLIVIEDLFSCAFTQYRAEILDRLLVRARGTPSEVVNNLPEASTATPAAVEVRRPFTLVDDAPWFDAEVVLACRAETESITRQGDRILINTVDRPMITLTVTEDENGWRARSQTEGSPIRSTSLHRDGDVVVYRVELAETVDLLRGGLRGRITFDLVSDLVTLSSR